MAPHRTLAASLFSAAAIACGVANMQPLAVQAQAVEPAGLDRPVVAGGWRENAPSGVAVEERRLHDRDAGIDEGRHLALRRGRRRPAPGSMAKSPRPS